MQDDWRDEVLTVRETATLLHVSPATVYRMLRDGILNPAAKNLGRGRGVTVIPKAEAEHYISSLKTAARRLTHA